MAPYGTLRKRKTAVLRTAHVAPLTRRDGSFLRVKLNGQELAVRCSTKADSDVRFRDREGRGYRSEGRYREDRPALPFDSAPLFAEWSLMGETLDRTFPPHPERILPAHRTPLVQIAAYGPSHGLRTRDALSSAQLRQPPRLLVGERDRHSHGAKGRYSLRLTGWQDVTPSVQVSRSRAMPAGGRRSEPTRSAGRCAG